MKAQRVVIIVGIKMSDGEEEPYMLLKAITEEGISCIEAVFTTINMHIALLAFSGVGLILSSARIASSPNGVAALPIPKRFADMFMLIRCMALVFLYSLPKRRLVTGERMRDIILVTPEASATSIMPDQKHIMGARVIMSSKAFFKPLFRIRTAASPPCVTAIEAKPAIIITDHIYVKMILTSQL